MAKPKKAPRPTPPEGHEKVPSYKVDAPMLRDWGFPVEERGHIVASEYIKHHGDRFEDALTSATGAGFARTQSTPDAERWWEQHQTPKFDQEMGNYFDSIKRPEPNDKPGEHNEG